MATPGKKPRAQKRRSAFSARQKFTITPEVFYRYVNADQLIVMRMNERSDIHYVFRGATVELWKKMEKGLDLSEISTWMSKNYRVTKAEAKDLVASQLKRMVRIRILKPIK